ncbi:MAG: hypothetical protein ABJG41_08280 [Cyclobacteriaceae bacterium]
MTREEILRSFLEDELVEKKGYLKKSEVESFKWTSANTNKLVEVIKFAIDGEVSNESSNITEKRINQYLNK